jgi:mannose-6-phosphate isomerase-like protein (cupin superfamily)
MTQQRNWQGRLEAPMSRRDALRIAAMGALGLSFVRPAALAQGTAATAAEYTLRLAQLPPATILTDVTARKGNKKAWAVLEGVSIAQVEVPVGAWRAPHLHTNTPELAVVLVGSAKAGLQTPQKEWLEVDLQAGDCVYFPLGWPHWFRNAGSGVLRAYFNYGHEQPETVEVPV